MLLVFNIMSLMDRQIVSLLGTSIQRDLALSDVQLGLLQGLAFALFYATTGLLLGWAVDCFPRRIVIFLGVVTWSLSCAAGALANSFTALFASRLGVGAGEAALYPGAYSLIRDVLPPHRAALGFGIFATGGSLGVAASFGVGGVLISAINDPASPLSAMTRYFAPWQAALLVTGLPGALFAFLILLGKEPARRGSGGFAGGGLFGPIVGCFRRYPKVLSCHFVGFTLSVLCSYSLFAWTPVYIERSFGWSPASIGYALALSLGLVPAVGALLGGFAAGRLLARGTRDAFFRVPIVLLSIGALAATAAFFATSAVTFLLLMSVVVFASGAGIPCAYGLLQMIIPSGLRGRMTSAFMLVQNLIAAAGGPLIVGALNEHAFGSRSAVGTSITITVLAATVTAAALLAFSISDLRSILRDVDWRPMTEDKAGTVDDAPLDENTARNIA